MLTDHRLVIGPAVKPGMVVVFLHYHGGTGAAMAQSVRDNMVEGFPPCVLRFPDGPEAWEDGGITYRSWFYLRDLENSNHPDPVVIAGRAAAATGPVHDYLRRVMAEEGVKEDRLLLAGFSAGAIAAFHAGVNLDRPVAGLFIQSGGALIDGQRAYCSKPDVFLSAGANELPFCGPKNIARTAPVLRKAGFPVSESSFPGRGHEISRESVSALGDFLKQVMPAIDPKPRFSTPGPG